MASQHASGRLALQNQKGPNTGDLAPEGICNEKSKVRENTWEGAMVSETMAGDVLCYCGNRRLYGAL